MKKNLYLYIILSTFILSTLVGCAKTPQEVKDEINKKQGFTEKITNTNPDLEYDTIDHIFESINDVKTQSFDNLKFTHEFEINKPDEIREMKFHQINNFLDNYKEVTKHFVGNSFNEKYLNLDLNGIPTVEYNDKGKKIYFVMRGKGYVCYISDIQYEFYEESQNDVTKVEEISLMQEYEDKSFELRDGNMKISEAVNLAQDYVEQTISKYDTFQWIPSNVIICKDDKGRYLYDIYFIKAYKNLYLSTTYSKNKDIKTPYMAIYENNVMIAAKDSPIFFRNNSGIIECEETIQDYDKIITFECATKLLSKKLSSYKEYEVQYVSLENKLVFKGNRKDLDIIYGPYNFQADNDYESKPCWTFYLDLTPGGGVYAMVDCITGEIEFVDNNR